MATECIDYIDYIGQFKDNAVDSSAVNQWAIYRPAHCSHAISPLVTSKATHGILVRAQSERYHRSVKV